MAIQLLVNETSRLIDPLHNELDKISVATPTEAVSLKEVGDQILDSQRLQHQDDIAAVLKLLTCLKVNNIAASINSTPNLVARITTDAENDIIAASDVQESRMKRDARESIVRYELERCIPILQRKQQTVEKRLGLTGPKARIRMKSNRVIQESEQPMDLAEAIDVVTDVVAHASVVYSAGIKQLVQFRRAFSCVADQLQYSVK
eukprot:TRINITY_DN4013_c1_g7_i1.p1 TRINITY_DN4013_c1_g7~~TRINITY_DN4013_c1_g7_i1.p1  ORF type:complete len:204 (+),score=44.89 TRINITY_DN4013_c1_g7_i1:170-781(+)